MFKKFNWDSDLGGQTNLKSSAVRALRTNLIEKNGVDAGDVDNVIPKKAALVQIKCKDQIVLILLNNKVLFFNSFDGPWIPTLRLVHRFPSMLPTVQVDKGAIKFVLSGANIMSPGLTSSGGMLPSSDNVLEKGTIVAVMAQGKKLACAIGILQMNTEEIKSLNQGIAIETLHYLGDDLWKKVAKYEE